MRYWRQLDLLPQKGLEKPVFQSPDRILVGLGGGELMFMLMVVCLEGCVLVEGR